MLFGQNSLTTQLVNIGMIEKAVGFCYMPPVRNSQCSAAPTSNTSRLVLGFGPIPTEVEALGGIGSMHSAPLMQYTYPPDPGATEPTFPEFRTKTISAAMLDFSTQKVMNINVSAANVLWYGDA